VLVCIQPEKAVPEMTYTVSGGTLNPTHSLTHCLLCELSMHKIKMPKNYHCKMVTLIYTKNWANAHETRESLYQFRFSSLAENWGVRAKLIYIYQILYNSSVAPPCEWYRPVSTPKIAKKSIIHKTPYFGVQGHWIRCQLRASIRHPISV